MRGRGVKRCILGIFAKAPVLGQVKTRLAARTGEDFAVRLAEAFLRDGVERYREVGDERLLVFSPPESRAWFAELALEAYVLEPQGEGDLGERLSAFFERRQGARVVVVGTDSPNLPVDWVRQAFTLLLGNDVVLGPARDGGYYLIGMNGFFSDVFRIADWGGATVFTQTLERIEAARLGLGLLPGWYDVDTVEDARFLKEHLRGQRSAGEATATPRTEEFLERWD